MRIVVSVQNAYGAVASSGLPGGPGTIASVAWPTNVTSSPAAHAEAVSAGSEAALSALLSGDPTRAVSQISAVGDLLNLDPPVGIPADRAAARSAMLDLVSSVLELSQPPSTLVLEMAANAIASVLGTGGEEVTPRSQARKAHDTSHAFLPRVVWFLCPEAAAAYPPRLSHFRMRRVWR